MKKMISNLLFRLSALSSMLIFFSLCYFRRIEIMKNDALDMISSGDTKLQGENNIFTPLQSWIPSNILDRLPYLDISPLEELVEENSQNGPTFVSDLNIDDILNEVQKENKKWNISSLTRNQIKDITKPKGIIKRSYSYYYFYFLKVKIRFDKFSLYIFFNSGPTR